MTKRDFQNKEYAAEQQAYVRWPDPPQANLFEDTNISANYLEQMALVMRKTNLKGASYVEDIASQLRDLGDDYVRLLNEREKLRDRIAELEAEKNTLLESEMWGVNCKPSPSNAEPVAWGVMLKNESPQVVVGNPSPWKHMYLYFMKHDADEWKSKHGGTVFPLYTEPQAAKGWLTAEERGSIQHAANLAKASWSYSVAQELENILARSSSLEVVMPVPPFALEYSDWMLYVKAVRAAIAAAGVKIKE